MLALLLALTACDGDSGENGLVIPTLAAPAPVATAVQPASAATATPLPGETATPPASGGATPTPAMVVPTASPQPTPCQFVVMPALEHAWLDIELGCPITGGFENLPSAYAPFDGGQMIWRGDNQQIYVLYNDGTWAQHNDLWREGDPEFTCGEASSPPTPIRGFGRVWCDHADVREGLGALTAAEIGDSGGSVQDFVNGLLMTGPGDSVFVLAGETATWRRVWPEE